MKFGFRHADKFVGLFILAALIFVISFLLIAGISRRWFARDYEFHTRFLSGDGLTVDQALKLRGFEIGKIRKITLNEQNQVDVVFVVYDTYLNKVTENSVLELVSNPIGAGGLNFYPGSDTKRLLKEYSYIPSNQSEEGQALLSRNKLKSYGSSDAISAILENINPVLMGAADITKTLNAILIQLDGAVAGKPPGPVGGILNNLEQTTAELNTILPGVENVVGELGKIAASLALLSSQMENPKGLVPTLLDPKGSLGTILNDDNELYGYLISILSELSNNLNNIAVLTGDLKGISPEINALLNEATGALQEGQKVLEGLKNNPLLRKGISKDVKTEASRGSLRDEEF